MPRSVKTCKNQPLLIISTSIRFRWWLCGAGIGDIESSAHEAPASIPHLTLKLLPLMPYHHMWKTPENRAPYLDYPGIRCRLISLDAVHDVFQEDVISDGPVLSAELPEG